ncbi:twin-arginine translocation signal domain-containing protein [Algoriphagus lacus]|uniref:Twin-arginine translocation signal domain-containing protein n=1 Tax=Algoriphagus lacus TaxID=2056311 RepID=A0A418PRP0_9BACT|nr:TIM barrel protein [Algoriphagus lacus]RIW15235.1 twin-arginine translocation signal domain-containing protein [Algoriphagus lacus]
MTSHPNFESRRDFLKKSSLAAAALAFPLSALPDSLRGIPMGVVVHSYGIRYGSKVESQTYPAFKDAIDLMRHCHSIGAGGIQTTVGGWAEDFSKKVRDEREKLGMYLEGSIGLPKNPEDVSRFEKEVLTAKEAGASVLRTVCLSGRRYENFKSATEWAVFRENSLKSIQLAEPIVQKHQVKLAIENHKDWKAAELAQLIQNMGSEWVGVTLDFGNNVSLLEEPMEVIRTLAPFAFSTHVKDMGVKSFEKGFLLSEVELGTGIVDLKEAVALCQKNNPTVTFSLEMITRDPLEIPCLEESYWTTFENPSAQQLAKILRLVRDNSYPTALPEVKNLSPEQRLAFEEENVVKCLKYSRNQLLS